MKMLNKAGLSADPCETTRVNYPYTGGTMSPTVQTCIGFSISSSWEDRGEPRKRLRRAISRSSGSLSCAVLRSSIAAPFAPHFI